MSENKNVPKLRFKEFSAIWIKSNLKETVSVEMGQSPESKYYNDSQGIVLIQGKADIIGRKTISRVFTSKYSKTVEENEIIMTVRAPVGYIAKSNYFSCIGRGVCSLSSKELNSDYLYQYLIKTENYWKSIEQGSTFSSISKDDINKLNISYPSNNSEQTKIADFLTSIDRHIELLEKKKELLEK
ncbi:MAG: restriction endonuclease subunit S, partial [Patescibacteria group bacterium]